MSAVVADTHALVWHLTDPDKLGRKAARALGQADAGRASAHVPALVLTEIALLHERGRLRFGAAAVVSKLAARPGWNVLAFDIEQALAFATLVGIEDPMDRSIAAAAVALGVPLVSGDETMDAPGLQRIWD